MKNGKVLTHLPVWIKCLHYLKFKKQTFNKAKI